MIITIEIKIKKYQYNQIKNTIKKQKAKKKKQMII